MLSAIDKKNAVWNTSVFIFSQILGFISYSLNLKTYGFDIFGYFLIIAATFGLGTTLDLGFGISTIKSISEANKKNDITVLNSIIVSFSCIFFILGLIISMAFLGYYYLIFDHIIIVKSFQKDDTDSIYILLTIGFFINFISTFFRSVFEGFAQYAKLGIINIFISFFNSLLMFLLFIFSLRLIYLAFFMLLSNVVGLIVLIVFLKSLPNINYSFKYFNFNIIKKYAAYSINLQLNNFIGSFVDIIMKYIIGSMLAYNYVSFFESSKRVINLSNGLINAFQRGLLNKLSEENSVGNLKEYISRNLFIFSKIANSYSVILYGIANPIICVFLLFWFNSYETVIIFLILSVPYCIVNFGGALYSVLMIEGKGIRLPLIQFINVLCVGIFLYFSISFFHNYLGIFGFWFACLINIILIIYFLIGSQSLNFKKYLIESQIIKIIMLTAILILQFVLMYFLRDYFYLELIVFFFIYLFLFYKDLKYFYSIYNSRLKIYKSILFNKLTL